MQEILFRGKRRDNGQWCEGFLYRHDPPLQCIAGEQKEQAAFAILKTGFADWNMPRPIEQHLVHGETVGQKVGRLYYDGDKIPFFEGDITIDIYGEHLGVVTFYYNRWVVKTNDGIVEIGSCSDWKHLGNIHDNPDLINNQ